MHAVLAENWLVYHYWSSANVRFQARTAPAKHAELNVTISQESVLACLPKPLMPVSERGHR